MTIDPDSIKSQALQTTQALLAESESFGSMPIVEQKALFRDIFNNQYKTLAQSFMPEASVEAMKKKSKKTGGASDLIDDERHYNKRIDEAGQMAGEFIREVDFPQFVSDLLKGVFDANLDVTIQQMESYQKLLKTATASISKFVRSIDDAASFGYLVENEPDSFGLDFSDDEKDENGEPKAVLTDKDGNPVDVGDNMVKVKIMDAKIAMAKEQRKLLRETILMGITRLVVQKGNVKASVLFDIKAKEKIAKADKAAKKKTYSHSSTLRASGGLLGSIFGGPKGSTTNTYRNTQVSVSSAKSEADSSLAAKLAGSVDITFKSDYFKLDNFLEIEKADIEASKPAQPQEKAKEKK